MTKDELYGALLITAKRVLGKFRSGEYPTFGQLEKLDAAIDGVEAEAICGHKLIEECDCAELYGEEK